MEPAVRGSKLASGLADKPVRLKHLVFFRGEKDVHRLADHLVRETADSPGEPPFRPQEQTAVANARPRRLPALGGLDMDDARHFLDSATE